MFVTTQRITLKTMSKTNQKEDSKTDKNIKDIEDFPFYEYPQHEIVYECTLCGNIQDFGGVCQQCGSLVIDQKYFS